MGLRESVRSRVDLTPGQHKPNIIRAGAIAIVLTTIFLYVIYTRPSVPFLSGGGQNVKAEFAFGANVRPGYTPVRVRGVEVGQVTKIERAPSGRGALITMNIKEGTGVQLKEDVRMALRWRTLLGRNMYVDIDQGSPSAAKFAGGVVPKTRTRDQVELDTTLEPFDARGRGSLQTLIQEFDKGFGDPQAVQGAVSAGGASMQGAGSLAALRGETPTNIRRATSAGGASMKASGKGLPGLRGENVGDLPKLVRGASRTLGELSRDERALGGLVVNGAGALGVTAARRADLASTLNTAPETLRQTRTTLARLETTLDIVDPLADELRPGLDLLPTTARNTQRTLDVARPLLSDLRPTLALLRPALTDLRTASRAGVPSFASGLNNTMRLAEEKFVPFLNARDKSNKRQNYTNIGPLIAHGGSALAWGDKNGAVANFEATVSETSFQSPCKVEISNPDLSQADRIRCELTFQALVASLTGRDPQEVTVLDSLIPKSVRDAYVTGKKKLPLLKTNGEGR